MINKIMRVSRANAFLVHFYRIDVVLLNLDTCAMDHTVSKVQRFCRIPLDSCMSVYL